MSARKAMGTWATTALVAGAIAGAATGSAAPLQGSWTALTGLSGGGGAVTSVAISGRYAYVGGSFTTATGAGTVNGVARYDLYTDTWSALGSGVDSVSPSNRVNALAVDANGDLWAGGSFLHMGSSTGPGLLARWNGTAWVPGPAVSLGTNVPALAAGGSNVYVMGNVSGYYAGYINVTGAPAWNTMGSGLNSAGESVSVDSVTGDAWFGGGFTSAGGVASTRYLAKWNATLQQWQSPSPGTNPPYGPFVAARDGAVLLGERIGSEVKTVTGSTWGDLGSSPFGGDWLRSVAFFGSTPIAGAIAQASQYPLVRSWDGAAWQPVGFGLKGGQVTALATSTRGIVAAGTFSEICGNVNCSATTPVSGVAVFESPVSTPGPPRDVSAVVGVGSATVSWSPPVDDGGSPITGYTVTAGPGGNTCSTTGATTCTVTGLTPGVGYTFTVVATNAQGSGTSSSPSAPVAPTADATPGGGATGQQGNASSGGGSASSSGAFTIVRAPRGSLTTTVRVPGPGALVVRGRAVGISVACIGSRAAKGAGVLAITCVPRPATQRVLRQRGLVVRLTVAYTPTVGSRSTRARTVALVPTAHRVPVTG